MKLYILTNLLEKKRVFLKQIQFAYIKLDVELNVIPFNYEEDLDRFVNSIEENPKQIILKEFNNKKSFFISMSDYDAVLVDDGTNIYISSFWKKQRNQVSKNIQPNFEKARNEIIDFFSSVEMTKLAS